MLLSTGSKITAVVLLLSLFAAPVTSVAAGSVKPGSACLKKGETTVSSGKFYTCVTSGKKLVWNSGIAVLKKATLPKIGTSCKGTKQGRQIGLFQDGAYAQVSCSPDGIWRYIPYYRVSQQTGRSEPYSYSSFPADIKNIFIKAWANLRAINNPGKPANLDIIYSGTVPQWHREIFEASKKVMLEKFGAWSTDGRDMYWVVADTPAAAIKAMSDLGKKLNASQSEIDSYADLIRSSDRWTTATIASGQNGSLAGHAVQLFNSWSEYGGNSLFDYHAATHEIFHPLMFQIVPAAIRNMPCWVNEGAASFVGDAILDPTGKYEFATLIDRQFFHGGGYTQGHPELTSAINTEKSPTQFCGEVGGYMEGDQIVTTLVGLYGWDKFEKFLTDKTASSWQEAFKNAYGITKDEFYVKMDDILKRIRSWAIANGH